MRPSRAAFPLAVLVAALSGCTGIINNNAGSGGLGSLLTPLSPLNIGGGLARVSYVAQLAN